MQWLSSGSLTAKAAFILLILVGFAAISFAILSTFTNTPTTRMTLNFAATRELGHIDIANCRVDNPFPGVLALSNTKGFTLRIDDNTVIDEDFENIHIHHSGGFVKSVVASTSPKSIDAVMETTERLCRLLDIDPAEPERWCREMLKAKEAGERLNPVYAHSHNQRVNPIELRITPSFDQSKPCVLRLEIWFAN